MTPERIPLWVGGTAEEWEVEMEYQRVRTERERELARYRRELREFAKGCVIGLVGSAGLVVAAYLILEVVR